MPFQTSRAILEAYRDYEYFGLIVYGPLRHGKSSIAIQILAEVYGILANPDWKKALMLPWNDWVRWVLENTTPDWNAWKKWMQFLPEEFFGMVDEIQKTEEQAPLGCWDDAGLWASQYRWGEEFAKRISEYVVVCATDFAGLIFTTPDPRWLLKHIRDMPGGHNGRVAKLSGATTYRTRRYMKVYEGWLMPDLKKSGVKSVFEDYYDIMLPWNTFQEYDRVRRGYARRAKERAMEIIKSVQKGRGEEYAEKVTQEIRQGFGVEV